MNVNWQVFRFPLDDERWKNKALIGSLLGVFGIFIWPLLLPLWGYGIRILRRTVKGEAPYLPEWDEWGGLFGDGLRMLVVGIVYTLPGLLLFCCAFGVLMFSATPGSVAGQAAGAQGPAMGRLLLGYAIAYPVLGVAGLLTLPLSVLAIVAVTRFVAEDSFGSAFEFGEVWRFTRAGFGNYLLAVAVFYGVVFLVSWLAAMFAYTIILLCLYPILIGVLGFYASVQFGALFGSAYYHTQSGLPAADEKALPA
jgi:hypothetical protein